MKSRNKVCVACDYAGREKQCERCGAVRCPHFMKQSGLTDEQISRAFLAEKARRIRGLQRDMRHD